MSSKIHPSLSLTIGTLIGSLSLNALAASSPAFQATELVSGYAVMQSAEGKCGEGRCAVAKLDKDGDGKVSMEEAKAAGFSDAQCKTWDANSDGALEANELAAMHAVVDAPRAKKKS